MNGLLIALSLLVFVGTAWLIPEYGGSAVLICTASALVVGFLLSKIKDNRTFLLQMFVSGLLLRMLVGLVIFSARMQDFFGGDALQYDIAGYDLMLAWQGQMSYAEALGGNFKLFLGMPYLVATIYTLVGRNLLAVQFVNAVLGAATGPVLFLCAQQIFHNNRVARVVTYAVTFYPSLVLWSSQGLKDAPIVFLLSIVMLATLKLGERFSVKWVVVLGGVLFGLLTLRFYIFYMAVAASVGTFIVGTQQMIFSKLLRNLAMLVFVGLTMTYFGVLRTATLQYQSYGNLESVQRTRLDLSRAQSGFGRDVDVSTTSGAISAIPIGLIYLLFAPFPWEVANLRQSLTLPEMLIWWGSFPLLMLGLWFTLRYCLRQALPILIFTAMLTLAYSIFQGNVGTAYRQRSQLLVFYFMFVAAGWVLLKERVEDRRQQQALEHQKMLQEAENRRREMRMTMARRPPYNA